MIRYCSKCKEYTLHKKCKECGGKVINKEPAKFRKRKNYSKQRLKVKGLL